MATPLSVLKKAKNGTLARKKNGDRTKNPYIYIYIYLESVSPGERHKHIYMATHLSVFKKPKSKNGTIASQLL